MGEGGGYESWRGPEEVDEAGTFALGENFASKRFSDEGVVWEAPDWVLKIGSLLDRYLLHMIGACYKNHGFSFFYDI